MGFRIPHYHCHVYPQYEDDDPFRLIDVTTGEVRLETRNGRSVSRVCARSSTVKRTSSLRTGTADHQSAGGGDGVPGHSRLTSSTRWSLSLPTACPVGRKLANGQPRAIGPQQVAPVLNEPAERIGQRRRRISLENRRADRGVIGPMRFAEDRPRSSIVRLAKEYAARRATETSSTRPRGIDRSSRRTIPFPRRMRWSVSADSFRFRQNPYRPRVTRYRGSMASRLGRTTMMRVSSSNRRARRTRPARGCAPAVAGPFLSLADLTSPPRAVDRRSGCVPGWP